MFFVKFHPYVFYIKDHITRKVVLQSIIEGGLYKLYRVFQSNSCLKESVNDVTMSTSMSHSIWLDKFNRISSTTINKVLAQNNYNALPINNKDKVFCTHR